MCSTGVDQIKCCPRKAMEKAYNPPSALHLPSQHEERSFATRFGRSRRLGAFLLTVAALAVIGLRLCHSELRPSHHDPGPSTSGAEPEFDWYAVTPASSIQWTPCYQGHKCARLLLPLDYDSPGGPKTAIALRLIPAADRRKYKGTILINPGGPGGSGTFFISKAGEKISRIIGDSFDILGFDPRGVGASTPAATCFSDDSQRRLWRLQDDHRLLNLTNGGLEIQRAREKMIAARCEQAIGGEWAIGRHMSTPNVARDMLEISQQLGQEKILYWGFSYGSVLGQYFAAMYPEKVGRLVIDGVYDALNYRSALWSSNVVDMDRVVGSFFEFCHQGGPEKCTAYDASPDKIRRRYFNLLDRIEREPVPIPLAEPPVILTRKTLVNQMIHAAYSPLSTFGLVADTMQALETNNQTALAALASRIVEPTECTCNYTEPWRVDDEAFTAIACGDGDEHPYDAATYAKFYEDLTKVSPLAAPLWGIYYLMCAEWRIRPKWRWTGPLGAQQTSHPLLVVSPRYDPVSPLPDAKVVHERFADSRLLVQNSFGHCSISAPSLCTAKYIRAYFENGTLPEGGTECEVDELPFVGRVGNAFTPSVGSEDEELFEALRSLSEAVPRIGGSVQVQSVP
ncbi:alpha/beta-hydrolase [Trametes coccinea BRFM310]|uniref:Alpha/beta-hydrolase n=1 Tax=Trametes coccinea (strain BRFM310) TaxID=1353009 RepID=A0A1Y2IAK9_TRAC3|nr:alpha/beta-hydrolase [Trametes coccinea BRFM310]